MTIVLEDLDLENSEYDFFKLECESIKVFG